MGAVLLWIGKALLVLLAAVLALLVLALIVPAAVQLRYEKGVLACKVRVLGIPIRVLPGKTLPAARQLKKDEKAARKAAASAEKVKRNEEKQKAKDAKRLAKLAKQGKKPAEPVKVSAAQKLQRLLYRLSCILQRAGWLAGKVLGCLRIRHVEMYLPVTKDTAAETALACGKLNAALGASLGIVQNFLDVRIDRWEIRPDFAGLEPGGEVFACNIHAQLIIMVAAGLYTFIKLLQDKAF